jgi:hypothetical protein
MKSVSKTILVVLVFGLLTSPLFCRQAHAAPIQGTIDFGGVVTYGDSTGANTMSLATATRVNLWNDPTFGPPIVLQRTGDFTSFVANGASVTMAAPPWIFNSGTPGTPMPGGMYPSFWTVGGFTFNLTSSTVISQSATFLNVSAVGTATGHGFDTTPGVFTFSSTQSNGSSNPTFSFQSQTAVPETNTVLLCGIGLAAIVALKFSRKPRF